MKNRTYSRTRDRF